jgi:2-polyprenyl-6-methoxyphenol hydroxylase-like FAD-dependent oxidoreductase
MLERLATDPPTRRAPLSPRLTLEDGAKILVIGAGPAGAFFAITLLREARRLGRAVEVLIVERRRGLVSVQTGAPVRLTPNCNYCAGGISPRMSDILEGMRIPIDPGIVQDRIRSVTVQSHWKNIELKVPESRRMFSVYRGSRPLTREHRLLDFDSLLLSKAVQEGAEVLNATATHIWRSAGGRPVVEFRRGPGEAPETVEPDFAVFAGGVNQDLRGGSGGSGLEGDLRVVMPGFAPPKLRRTLIFELELSRELAPGMEGELYFILFGSRHLRLEMGSLMPKGRFVTVVLIGPDIDRGLRSGRKSTIVDAFLSLPHVERILPRRLVRSTTSCICRPNMVVGCAANPIGDRVAAVGDLVTSRLYKDGIYSAYLTGSGLAHAILKAGIDRQSLRGAYLPLVRRLEADQRFGRTVFLTIAIAFRNPVLSRMAYQAVLRERRMAPESKRPLEGILWRVASGDDTYAAIFGAMLHPLVLLSFLGRGVLITVRNQLTELIFGLSWRGFGRFPTGVYLEDVDAKVGRLGARPGIDISGFQDFRRMYSIRIRAPRERIFDELGMLGDPRREYLRQRFVDIRRTAGKPNAPGSVIEYSVLLRPLSFGMVLERSEAPRYLVYRVLNGFARNGIMVFDVEERRPRDCVLSILVAFDFCAGAGILRRVVWALYRRLFPTFVHDVLWNHALCKLKDVIERPEASHEETEPAAAEISPLCVRAGESSATR